jgi:hypothetical protein
MIASPVVRRNHGKLIWRDNNFRISSRQINGANGATFAYDADSLMTGAGAMTLTRDSQNGLLTSTALGDVSDTIGYNGFGELKVELGE